jgi:hypothetical protein
MALVMVLAAAAGGMKCEAAGDWEYAVTPYLFLPALDLDSTVAGQTVPVDLSFSDVWDTFDVLAFSIRGEAWKDQWGAVGDFYWVDLEAKGGPNDSVKVNIEEWYVDALAGWRWIMPTKFRRAASADVTFGLRFHSLEQKVGTAAAPRDLGGSDDWIDIMIGGRYMRPFSESWLFLLRGDIGGFDLTDGTRLNYSATGGFGWGFHRNWLLDFGYRLYGIDYESGSGPDNFGMDGIEHGLWLGVSYAPVGN